MPSRLLKDSENEEDATRRMKKQSRDRDVSSSSEDSADKKHKSQRRDKKHQSHNSNEKEAQDKRQRIKAQQSKKQQKSSSDESDDVAHEKRRKPRNEDTIEALENGTLLQNGLPKREYFSARHPYLRSWSLFVQLITGLIVVGLIVQIQLTCLYLHACPGSDEPTVASRIREAMVPLAVGVIFLLGPVGYWIGDSGSKNAPMIYVLLSVVSMIIFASLMGLSFTFAASSRDDVSQQWDILSSSLQNRYTTASNLIFERESTSNLIGVMYLILTILNGISAGGALVLVYRIRYHFIHS